MGYTSCLQLDNDKMIYEVKNMVKSGEQLAPTFRPHRKFSRRLLSYGVVVAVELQLPCG